MPKVSRTHADRIEDHGVVLERTSEVDGYTINLVQFNEAQDITGLLATLTHKKCMCPHMGYVVTGRVGVRYDDGAEETIDAGEAFYMPAGHTSWWCDAGTEIVQFSPSDLLAEVDAAIAAAMKAQAGTSG